MLQPYTTQKRVTVLGPYHEFPEKEQRCGQTIGINHDILFFSEGVE